MSGQARCGAGIPAADPRSGLETSSPGSRHLTGTSGSPRAKTHTPTESIPREWFRAISQGRPDRFRIRQIGASALDRAAAPVLGSKFGARSSLGAIENGQESWNNHPQVNRT